MSFLQWFVSLIKINMRKFLSFFNKETAGCMPLLILAGKNWKIVVALIQQPLKGSQGWRKTRTTALKST